MKHLKTIILFIPLACSMLGCNNETNETEETMTFYEVPLVCGAAPEIGCGSRIKPLFIDTEKQAEIKESWSNRQGTVIAIVWNYNLGEKDREATIQPLFEKHEISSTLIKDIAIINELKASMKKDQWYNGMRIDQLSMEEAGFIAEDVTGFAEDAGLINPEEAKEIGQEVEAYFKKELVVVRTCNELKSPETQGKWMQDVHSIFATHIGAERADSVRIQYEKMEEKTCKKESACTSGKNPCCKAE